MKKIIFTISCLFLLTTGWSQETHQENSTRFALDKGMELFEKQKFGIAQKYFDQAFESYSESGSPNKALAQYYGALCAVQLYHDNAVYLMNKFINENSTNPLVNRANFHLGRFFYANKKYDDVVSYLSKVNNYYLEKDESAEYFFKLGYAYYMEGDTVQAKSSFFQIIDVPSRFYSPAVYYYSHIHYTEKNYQTALNGFLKLTDDETFGAIVPYYITQLYYLQKNYPKVVEEGPKLLENVTEKRKAEVVRIIAESYYYTKDFEKSLEYFDIYRELSDGQSSEDNYMVALAYYRANKYEEAAKLFEKVSESDTKLGQNAAYFLADAYLKTNQKIKAQAAFYTAYQGTENKKIKEDALFNYAVLTHELALNPFNESVKAFQLYIKEYPTSYRIDDARKYLLAAYLASDNYEAAYEELDKIKSKSPQVKKAYQKMAFNRGIELFNIGDYDKAINMFDISDNYQEFDATTSALSNYWKGECFFRKENYVTAIENYKAFIVSLGVFNLDEYPMAHYNLGYAYFKRKDYAEAGSWFRKFENLNTKNNPSIMSDAYNRIADCYYIQSQYWPALDYYQKAANLNTSDADYAYFQLGFTYGLVDRVDKKIEVLTDFLAKYPNSGYADNAVYHVASSYVVENKLPAAEKQYKALIVNYSTSALIPKAKVSLGLLLYNQNRNAEAKQLYQDVVATYPGTKEAKDALIGLKNIHVEGNDVQQFFDYVKELDATSEISINISEQDSLTYLAAERVYMKGDCVGSVNSLENYIQQFPKGHFTINAHFYLGDCYFQQKEFDKALAHFQYINAQQNSVYSEQSLLGTCRIHYAKKDYESALIAYKALGKLTNDEDVKLETLIGQLNCYSSLESDIKTIEVAEKILAVEKLSFPITKQVKFKYGKALFNEGQYQKAIEELRIPSENLKTEEGAEAKYLIAMSFYQLDKWPQAESVIYDFIDKNTPHQYWIARSFLLLADIFIDTGDDFQANHTLNSVIDNYTNREDGIYTEAWKKKKALKAKMAKEKEQSNEPLDVEFNDK